MKALENEQLILNLQESWSLRYGKVIGEPEFHSNEMGSFTYWTNEEEIKYVINKFVIKVKKSEHQLSIMDNLDVKGEMQIHGQTSGGRYAILSILIVQGDVENKYITNLAVNKLKYEDSSEPQEVELKCVKGKNDPNPTKFDLRDFMGSNK